MTANFVSPLVRLLLCDDSSGERQALARILRHAGYEVMEAGDGAAAIAHLERGDIDTMLLDLQMPNVDGFEVLRFLTEHQRGLPVILLSGMPLHKIQDRFGALPPDLPPLLIKPVDPDQVLRILELQRPAQ